MKRVIDLSLVIGLSLIMLSLFTTKMRGEERGDPFLFKRGNSTIKFGGFAAVNSSLDFGGAIDDNDFKNSSITVPNSWEKESRFNMDASITRLSVKGLQRLENGREIEFYVEGDFRGAGSSLRLRHGYLSYRGFILGQSWGFMNDIASQAPTIDVQAANSRTFYRTPLMGYRRAINNWLSMGISLELPTLKMTTQPTIERVSQRVPDIPFYLQIKGELGHLKLAGALRTLDYGLIGEQKIKSEVGFGGQLSGSIRVGERVMLYTQAIYGKGVGRYINDLALLNIDLVPGKSINEQQSLKMYSFSVGAKINFTKELYGSAIFANAALLEGEGYYNPNQYAIGNWGSLSLFWEGIKNLTVATEYIHGKRENLNGNYGVANRVQLLFLYKW